jgi:phosphoribosyl 1,2-cyclic phosphodiesterase
LLRFASLGSGSKGNCLVAESRDDTRATRVLVDCGFKLRETERRLARIGLAPADIDAILVTHEHSDHACGVFDFAAAHSVAVYATHGCLAALREEGKLVEGVRIQVINGKEAFAVDAMEIAPYTVPHDAREPVQYVLSDGAARLGVLTDIGASTAHVEQTLSGLDALVLETNYDADMLWGGAYPKWLKARIAGRFGHLDNRDSERLLGALDRSRLKHVVAAHLSQHNNRPELARAALARAMGCEESWIGVATQEDGCAWREML